MATFSKIVLSGSTGGLGIKVAATSGSGTLIHTSGTSASVIDEVWLYAVNSNGSAATRKLTIQYGGTTDPDHFIEQTINAESGLYLVVPGLVICGDGTTGKTIRAICSTANEVMLYGYINRIIP